jgi:hypothetical protein
MKYSYDSFVEELRLGSEIEFTYSNVTYFLTYDKRGTILMDVDKKIKQIFKDDDDFLENAVIDSKKIIQIWDEVTVETIY